MDILGPLNLSNATNTSVDATAETVELDNQNITDSKGLFSQELDKQVTIKNMVSDEVVDNMPSTILIDAEAAETLESIKENILPAAISEGGNELPAKLAKEDLEEKTVIPLVSDEKIILEGSKKLSSDELAMKLPEQGYVKTKAAVTVPLTTAQKAIEDSESANEIKLTKNLSDDIDLSIKTETINPSTFSPENKSTEAVSLKSTPKELKLDMLNMQYQQQPLTPAVSTTNTASTEIVKLPLHINNAEWGNSFSEKVTWLTNQKIQSATIEIDPPELGRIEVKIDMTQENTSIKFLSNNQAVRDAIEQSLARLKDDLGESGFNQVNVDVSDQASEQQAKMSGNAGAPSAELSPEETQQTVTQLKGDDGLIDFYA